MLLPLLPALLAALAPPLPCGQAGPPPSPLNSSLAPPPAVGGLPAGRRGAGATARAGDPLPGPPVEEGAAASCNISVQRQRLSSLLVRWAPGGAPCDLALFSTGGAGGRAFFSAAFHRVGPPPLLIEHVGLAAGGVQQDLRLCVGCSRARGPQARRLRPGGAPAPPPPAPPPPAPPAAAAASPLPEPGQPWQQGERLHFCCLDFSLEELKGDPGWRMNRKPIESTLVACFMTLVIIVWSVAALIWPVPIIAGFLPNGMEQRRQGAPPAAPAAPTTTAK
uniref:transmembrane protein 158 n=1 Tax=Euleptes europaea TaxID=460621 RepID=UPI0025402BA1|nr:transmembrane protein 158 [Euleptes europaea]